MSIWDDLVGVQPMAAPTGKIYSIVIRSYKDVLEEDSRRPIGTLRHGFLDGYMIWTGQSWIPEHLYWFLKIKGLMK